MRFALGVALLVTSFGCSDEGSSFEYPRDSTLRFQHVQALGTHNSYHVAPDPFQLPDWNYTHAPLDAQLARGVRQLELDINVNPFDDRFEVYHIVRIDDGTTCFLLTDCLRTLKSWSDANPGHHPFIVMVELKDGFDADYAEHFFDLFESELLSVWPEDRLITPDLVRGEHATLREAVAADGWPTLGEVRGRGMFFLLDRGEHRTFYTYGDTSLDGRLAFVTSDPSLPYAAVTNVDNPNDPDLAASLAAGMLVRTRVDTMDDNGPVIDQARLEAALESGAQFLSSDDPSAGIPGGTPSRCNPVTAPPECASEDLENPAFIH